MSVSTNSYKAVFKTTMLFGFVQLLTVIVSVIRTKFVALWLGASGYGIISLFNTAINLIFSISNLGFQSSVVRDVAYYNSLDKILLERYLKAILRWLYILGLLGTLLMIILSPLLSFYLFGSYDYTFPLCLLSVVLFLNTLYNGYYSILQGLREVTNLLKANAIGALLGLGALVPILYFYKSEGILYGLIANSLVMTIVAYLYTYSDIKKVSSLPVAIRQTYLLGMNTAKLGIAISINTIFASLISFILSSFIVSINGISEVGLYQAGWALNEGYVGLVFSALAKDYLPRLTENINDKGQFANCVNQQSELTILLLGPLLILMICFLKVIITLFYSEDFIAAEIFTVWLLVGSFVRAASLGISHVFLALGDGKLFLQCEILIKLCLTLPLYLLGYKYWGLSGIGVGFLIQNVIYLIVVSIVVKRKYDFVLSKKFNRSFYLQTIFFSLCILMYFFYNNIFVKILFLFIVSAYSIYELNKRMLFFNRHK